MDSLTHTPVHQGAVSRFVTSTFTKIVKNDNFVVTPLRYMCVVMVCCHGNRDGCTAGLRQEHGVESLGSDGDRSVVGERRAVAVECVWISVALFPRRPAWVGVVNNAAWELCECSRTSSPPGPHLPSIHTAPSWRVWLATLTISHATQTIWKMSQAPKN